MSDQPMAFDTPGSSMTSRVAYSSADRVLSLTFRSDGKTHHLADVDVNHFEALRTTDSVGRYFHKHLKSKASAR